jgi:hypothetical protein
LLRRSPVSSNSSPPRHVRVAYPQAYPLGPGHARGARARGDPPSQPRCGSDPIRVRVRGSSLTAPMRQRSTREMEGVPRRAALASQLSQEAPGGRGHWAPLRRAVAVVDHLPGPLWVRRMAGKVGVGVGVVEKQGRAVLRVVGIAGGACRGGGRGLWVTPPGKTTAPLNAPRLSLLPESYGLNSTVGGDRSEDRVPTNH